jgi:hypothetical protein
MCGIKKKLELSKESSYTDRMKNKENTKVDLSKYVVFIPVKNDDDDDDVLSALSEILGEEGNDFDTIFGNDYIIVPHYKKEEILSLIAEIEAANKEEE